MAMQDQSAIRHWTDVAWRTATTGLAFAVAGICSLMLALIVFPILRVLPSGRRSPDARAQLALSRTFGLFFSLLTWLGVLRLEVRGAEVLSRPGSLVVANHPTLIDALALMSFMPQADCVVKGWYYENFWLSHTVRAAGYIPNRNGPDLVEACAERLRAGRSVLIFPEGTRSPKDGLGEFERGAAHIAIRANVDPLPVTIRCTPATLYRGLPWWKVPERRFTLSLDVGDPIPIEEMVETSPSRARAARAVTRVLRNHFERELEIDRARRAA